MNDDKFHAAFTLTMMIMTCGFWIVVVLIDRWFEKMEAERTIK